MTLTPSRTAGPYPRSQSRSPRRIFCKAPTISILLSNSPILPFQSAIAVKMEREDIVESPRKRLKVDNAQTADNDTIVAEVPAVESSSSPVTQATREVDVGITEFVSADIPGFEGVLKKRFVKIYPRGLL